jgi:hypothetical protein
MQELVKVMQDAGNSDEAVRVAGRVYMQDVCQQVLSHAEYPAPGLYICMAISLASCLSAIRCKAGAPWSA